MQLFDNNNTQLFETFNNYVGNNTSNHTINASSKMYNFVPTQLLALIVLVMYILFKN
jgi:hypothetical protein